MNGRTGAEENITVSGDEKQEFLAAVYRHYRADWPKQPDDVVITVAGVAANLKPVLAAAGWQAAAGRQLLVVVADEGAVRDWREQLLYWQPPERVRLFPLPDWQPERAIAGREWLNRRLATLKALRDGEPVAVVCTVAAAVAPLPAPDRLSGCGCRLAAGQTWPRDRLIERLASMGYERAGQTEHRGQFSLRGGIIDIYPVNDDWPIRVELADDQIASLRRFSPLDQLSVASLELTVEIMPLASEWEADSCLPDYFAPGTLVVADEPAAAGRPEDPVGRQWQVLFQRSRAAGREVHALGSLILAGQRPLVTLNSGNTTAYLRQFANFASDVRRWQQRGWQVVIWAGDRQRRQTLADNLGHAGVECRAITFADHDIGRGFYVEDWQLAVVTIRDLYGGGRRRSGRVAGARPVDVFSELRPGDYVVHEAHGIGIYEGVRTIADDSVHRDYFLVRYAGSDRLYVPVGQVDQLHRYIGGDDRPPQLSRLGSDAWRKARARARAATEKLAGELLRMAAQRGLTPGHPFAGDNDWQKEMEDDFPYQETADQLAAIADVKADMEMSRPMDRLLCGDVGFGKTEVAVRAVFKAVMGGKQAAVLAPTTVLAEQHFRLFSQRYAPYGVAVATLNRFHSPAEQREVFRRAAAGTVDVVIGTHRLLNRRLKFRDLGLIVVDEEQRFGVQQKEKMKRWQPGVDILTLSATPIPRTLHMSLAGVRDISLIETPPADRLPVQTYVLEYRPEVVGEIIHREVSRGGQVYFVYNRVETIDRFRQQLAELVPQVTIGVAHGQMADDHLEEVMYRFYQGRIDVLLCTVLIENGLDVANANTLVVYDADRLGLAQLYQLKGRVGRSERLAYAYFTFRRGKNLSQLAEKRLRALQEFTDLGAGFKVAMRDLELRGAGNLLGPEQHGHIAGVGFEMYCRLLQAEMNRQRGLGDEPAGERATVDVPLDAWLPDDYVGDSGLKLDIYRKIAQARTAAELDGIAEELCDRFGRLPPEAGHLLAGARWTRLLPRLGFVQASLAGDWLQLHLDQRLPPGHWEKLARTDPGRPTGFRGGARPVLAVRLQSGMLVAEIDAILDRLAAQLLA
ncbi:MAG: transcription-repair coupling factor [Negativicutes bacterium]|nr:transcription-repair coupling factor [Negativicutes bacterium]